MTASYERVEVLFQQQISALGGLSNQRCISSRPNFFIHMVGTHWTKGGWVAQVRFQLGEEDEKIVP